MDMQGAIDNEKKMWNSAVAGNGEDFLKVVDENAVMVCGGMRCTGKEYAGFIKDMKMSDYEITRLEMVCNDKNSYEIHYVVETEVFNESQNDFAGKFHIASTWKNFGDKYKLVFNMDSRIFE